VAALTAAGGEGCIDRRPHGHGLPLHRRGGQPRRDRAGVPGHGPRVHRDRPPRDRNPVMPPDASRPTTCGRSSRPRTASRPRAEHQGDLWRASRRSTWVACAWRARASSTATTGWWRWLTPRSVEKAMYMIGQVATLRSDRTTIADLHAEVSIESGPGRRRRAATGLVGRRPRRAHAARPRTSPSSAWPRCSPIGRRGELMVGHRRRRERHLRGTAGAIGTRISTTTPSRSGPAPDARRRPKWGGFLPAVGFDALAYGHSRPHRSRPSNRSSCSASRSRRGPSPTRLRVP